MKVLLADDDNDDRHFFNKALKSVKVPTELTRVADGEALLNFLIETKQLPDVIFLDLNMPRKTGSECLAEIKQHQRLKHIPVVIYSTSLHDEVAKELYQKGAHFYLKKCVYSELPAALEKILKLVLQNPHQPPYDEFIVKSLVL